MQCGKSYDAGTDFCPADGSELMRTLSDPLIGTTLPRRYHIVSLLGRGSMSVVYKGIYEPLDQPVAIKMLKSHLVSDPQQAKRFQHEIKTAGTLNHPSIVGVLDFGFTGQGIPYLIMEYLEGKSLAEIIEEEERISVHRAIELFSQTTDALDYAHHAGVIHRDIKPSNILICKDGEREKVKILDFGIAKLMSAEDTIDRSDALGLTATGEVLGTPLYMSPEQANGKTLDARSDIYALGCVMYHALTGTPPFVGDTALDTMRLQISAQPKPIEQVRPDLYFPPLMQKIVMRCLSKDPKQRYQSMAQLKDELHTCLPRRERHSSESLRRLEPEPATVAQKAPSSLVLKLSAAFGALFLVGMLSAAIWGHKPSATTTSQPAKKELPPPRGAVQQLAAAQTALSAGEYAKAEQLFKLVIDDRSSTATPDKRAAALNGLASTYFAQDKLEDAKSTCAAAVALQQNVPQGKAALADMMINLSKISCALLDDEAAEHWAQESLRLRQSLPNSTARDQAPALQCLAGVECARKNYRRADELLSTALKALPSDDSIERASIENDLGSVRVREGKYASADELLNKALATRRALIGPNSPAVADTLCMLGTVDFNRGKDLLAESSLKDALAIRQSLFGEQSSRTAEVYSCLGILYDARKDYVPAEQCYRKALNIREALWGTNNPQLEHSLKHLIDFLHRYHQDDEAAVYQLQLKRIKTPSK